MAVNRYFERTLMPYNPIERPMPFDQLLQAGLMKQQALDRTNAAISEFQEQKMLTGGARTNTAAQQLNQEYGGKASALTDRIMTGEITPDQAAYELRNINKAYNTDPAVKQVLMDQSLMNVSNQAIMNERLRAGRAENPYYDYDSQTFRQAKLDDLRSGKEVIGADNYALLTDPGLFEDFKGMLAQVHEQYFKEQDLDVYFDQGTMQYKEKSSNNVVGIDPDRLKQMITEYVTAAPIENSDMQSVQYRLAKARREGNEYAEQQLIDELMQVTAFKPWMSVQTTKDLSGLGGGGKGSKKTEAAPSTVTLEVGSQRSGTQDVRNAIYGINPENPTMGIHDLLKDDASKLQGANKKLAVKGYRLKEGSTIDNPIYEYIQTGEEVKSVADKDAASNQLMEFKNDINTYEGIIESVEYTLKKQLGGKTFDELVKDYMTKYDQDISNKTDQITATYSKGEKGSLIKYVQNREGFESDMNNVLGKGNYSIIDESETGGAMGMMNIPAGVFVPSDVFFPEIPISQRGDHIVKELATITKVPENTANIIRANPDLIPLEMAQYLKSELKEVVETHVYPEMTMEVIGEKDPNAYRLWKNSQDEVKRRLDENARYYQGVAINAQEGDEGIKAHRDAQYYVRRTTDLVTKKSEGTPGSQEKGGITLGQVYEETGADPDDFALTVAYMQEGPRGSAETYGRLIYSPKGKVDEEVRTALKDKGYLDFDVNISDIAEDLFGEDIQYIQMASSMMKDHVYTMKPGDSREVYIPGKYGPATKAVIKMEGEGVKLEGTVYGADRNGNIVKKDVMDFFYENNPQIPRGYPIPIDQAADYAAQISVSAAGVRRTHKYLVDNDGNYIGEDVPNKVEDRQKQVSDSLNSNIESIRKAFPNLDPEVENFDLTSELERIIKFETNKTFLPSVRNTTGEEGTETAIGLIQFYQDDGKERVKTIGKKEFTFEELARMSIPNQITKAMIPYLEDVGSRVKTKDDLYFAIFMPVFAGMRKDLTLEEAYEAGVEAVGKEKMKNLTPAKLRAANKQFANARTLNDILDVVEKFN